MSSRVHTLYIDEPVITGVLVDGFDINAMGYWAIAGFGISALLLLVSLKANDLDKIDGDPKQCMV